jgi:hypothetical protein
MNLKIHFTPISGRPCLFSFRKGKLEDTNHIQLLYDEVPIEENDYSIFSF